MGDVIAFWQSELSENTADWAAVFVTTISAGIAAYIGWSVRRLSQVSERSQTTHMIYQQWMAKKELSIQYPAIAQIDQEIYSPGDSAPHHKQQEKIWLVLIIDILFNSYVAQKKDLYPREVYLADMEAHLGAMARHDAQTLRNLLRERGYFGDGVLGEFYREAMSVIDRHATKPQRPKTGKPSPAPEPADPTSVSANQSNSP